MFDYHSYKEQEKVKLKEPIEAWRCWRVLPDGQLMGIGVPNTWTPLKPVRAVHDEGSGPRLDHAAPGKACPCGYWGIKDFPTLIGRVLRMSLNYDADQFATGTCNMWGKVYEFEIGWRAQYAYPNVIYLPNYLHNRAQKVADMYKVDVVKVAEHRDIPALLRMERGDNEDAVAA